MAHPSLAVVQTFEFLGFYLPSLLIWAIAALIPYVVLRWVLMRLELYRFIWHSALLNLCLYVLLVGAIVFVGQSGWL